MDAKHLAKAAIEEQSELLLDVSHKIHGFAETSFEEFKSAELLVSTLSNEGFEVSPVDGYPTAFIARFGNGSLNIGICAEYDALSGIGHACGHNIIAAAALGAGIGLSKVSEELDLTVTVLGTPAEEGGCGKVFMLQNGSFDGLHAAMMVHPGAIDREAMPSLALSEYWVDFYGKSAHAAAHPERGVSASAAMTLAQTGIGLLREHMEDEVRVHGIVFKGGDAPNIVPEHTRGRWFIRAQTVEQLREVEQRIFNVFKGAALMTGCKLKMAKDTPMYTEIKTNESMISFWNANAGVLGRRSTPVTKGDGSASTDMGNVSYAMPSIHPYISIESDGAHIHEAAFEKAAIGASGDKAVLDGATAMAWTAIDVATDKTLRDTLVANPYKVSEVPESENVYLDRDYAEPITFP